MTEPQFPVIGVSEDGSVIAYNSKGELRSCSVRALSSGYYNSLRIFDCRGRSFQVTGVRVVAPLGIGKLLSRRREVDIDYVLHGHCTLEATKCVVQHAIAQDPEFWEATGQDVRTLVSETGAFEELIDLFR